MPVGWRYVVCLLSPGAPCRPVEEYTRKATAEERARALQRRVRAGTGRFYYVELRQTGAGKGTGKCITR